MYVRLSTIYGRTDVFHCRLVTKIEDKDNLFIIIFFYQYQSYPSLNVEKQRWLCTANVLMFTFSEILP
jgi:hypothetical protein